MLRTNNTVVEKKHVPFVRLERRRPVTQLWKGNPTLGGGLGYGTLSEDPTDLLDVLLKLPLEHAAEEMMAWYRSGDLWRVAIAAHFFVHSDFPHLIDDLISQLRSAERDIVEKAIDTLIRIGEPVVRKIICLLSDPDLLWSTIDILAKMDKHVVPVLVGCVRNQSMDVRIGLISSLMQRRDRDEVPTLR